jgi:hypothetical protein
MLQKNSVWNVAVNLNQAYMLNPFGVSCLYMLKLLEITHDIEVLPHSLST